MESQLPIVVYSTFTCFTPASWDHLPNKLAVSKPSFTLILEEYKPKIHTR